MKNYKRYRIAWGMMLAVLGSHAALAADAGADAAPGADSTGLHNQAPDPIFLFPDATSGPQLLGAQYTWIRQRQYALDSPYSGERSLYASGDTQGTHTFGLYFGWAFTEQLQAYVDIEKFNGAGVSNASGVGGLTNGDVIRQGSSNLPKDAYAARKYLRYLVPLTTDTADPSRAQGRLPGKEAATRLEFKAGTFAANDDFDVNRYANSTRTQFLNWSLWNNTAWDYAADTRGFTNGVMAGFISPTWSLRFGVYQMPSTANGYDLDAPITKARGEHVELTLAPNEAGTVLRLMYYRNIARMGVYRDALAHAAPGTAPDIVAEGQDGRQKIGYGINLEQALADGGETGLFMRLGWNDGKTETFAFTEVDRTFTVGLQMAGKRWGRGDDRLGLALAVNGLSAEHRDYLAAGGSGFVLGDGALNYGTEQIVEAYYRIQLHRHVQLSPDFQFIRNPGFNQDRGPAKFFAFRLHAEY